MAHIDKIASASSASFAYITGFTNCARVAMRLVFATYGDDDVSQPAPTYWKQCDDELAGREVPKDFAIMGEIFPSVARRKMLRPRMSCVKAAAQNVAPKADLGGALSDARDRTRIYVYVQSTVRVLALLHLSSHANFTSIVPLFC